MEIDDLGDRPPVVRDLIDKWDGLLDEGRWTTGRLYYEDGSVAEGRIDVGRLTYDENGHDRYRRVRPVHWSTELSTYDGSRSSDGRKILRLEGFMDEEDRQVRQSVRDQDVATMATETRESTTRSQETEAREVGGRRPRMARGMTAQRIQLLVITAFYYFLSRPRQRTLRLLVFVAATATQPPITSFCRGHGHGHVHVQHARPNGRIPTNGFQFRGSDVKSSCSIPRFES